MENCDSKIIYCNRLLLNKSQEGLNKFKNLLWIFRLVINAFTATHSLETVPTRNPSNSRPWLVFSTASFSRISGLMRIPFFIAQNCNIPHRNKPFQEGKLEYDDTYGTTSFLKIERFHVQRHIVSRILSLLIYPLLFPPHPLLQR